MEHLNTRAARPAGFSVTGGLTVIWALLAPIAGVSPVCAQGPSLKAVAPASIEGAVTTTGPQGPEAVPGVTVALTGGGVDHESLSAETDAEAHLQFSNTAPGECTLAVTVEGFDSFTETVNLKPGENRVESIKLGIARVVQKVEVHDQPANVATQSADTTSTIGARQFTILPLAEQKFKSVLPLVPSVVRVSDGKLNFKVVRKPVNAVGGLGPERGSGHRQLFNPDSS